MADYSKWDALAREQDLQELREKEAKRQENRDKYYRDQEERKKKFIEDKKNTDAAAAAAYGHAHGGSDGHNHGGGVPLLEQVRRPACGCGYADVDEMKRAAEEAAKHPQLSTAEKNRKKVDAVHATREHGKLLFQSGEYEKAFAVYERGVLIATGIFELSPEETQQMTDLEVILDLNMAACKLKLKEWKAAIEQCRMALQLDGRNVKAHFRWGSALVGLGEYEEARTHFEKAMELDGPNGASKKEVLSQLAEIKRLEAQEKAQGRKWTKQLEEKMKKEKNASFATTGKDGPTDEKENSNDSEDVSDLAASLRAAKVDSQTAAQAAEQAASWHIDGPNQQPRSTSA